ncbi:MAG: 30S ribosomal protein S9 [Pseudomonadota bacterium]|nr:30S ribosomal protein S9 [Pseudomonadota bacterium]
MIKKVKKQLRATGRRKQSVARLILIEGTGKFTVNGKSLQAYFGENTLWYNHAIEPISLLAMQNMFDAQILVHGGGISGQSGAVSLAFARALDLYASGNGALAALEKHDDVENEDALTSVVSWRSKLKKSGLLTRDSRVVLRKRVGLVKARKAKQFSKR